ncbi:hypothetical protein J4217_01350 [Candidatus Pacearchaeota archaeon]|nr:hypothetical protein [Candidatus Pacearchaeota archaeon]
MNKETKFLLASVNSGRSRSSKYAEKVFQEALKQNGKIPFQIIVDGYAGYQDGCRKHLEIWDKKGRLILLQSKGIGKRLTIMQ